MNALKKLLGDGARRVLGLAAAAAMGGSAMAAVSTTRTDYGAISPTVDGVIGANEYGNASANNYSGGGTGFGGVLNGANRILMKSDASNLYIAFTPGANLNDFAVMYLDTKPGGFNDATMADTGDTGRNIVTNLGSFGNDGFPFLADYALLMHGGGCTLFELNGGSLNVLSSTSANCASGNNTTVREVRIALTDIAAYGGNRQIDFFVAYCSGSLFNSNETIPPIAAINGAANPGTTATVNYVDNNRFITCSPIVISQIFGGNSGAAGSTNCDYIELHNRAPTAIDLSTYSIQYAAATGTSWARQVLTGFIPANGYFLIRTTATGSTTGTNTPYVDNAFNSPDMSGTAGKLALINGGTVAATGQNATPPAGAFLASFLGYGTTADAREAGGPPGSPAGTTANNAPAPSSTTAIFRAGCGATQTLTNSADWAVLAAGTPRPRNSLSFNTGLFGVGTPGANAVGGSLSLTVTPITCTGAAVSAGATATINLTALGGSASFAMTGPTAGAFTVSGFTIPATQTPGVYYLNATVTDGGNTGVISTPVSITSAVAPPNDVYNTNVAQHTVPSNGGVMAGTTVNATNDSAASCGTTPKDVYYYFTPAVTGTYAIYMCYSALNWDSTISVHVFGAIPNATIGVAPGNQLASATCSDTGLTTLGCGASSVGHGNISVALTAGTTYTIRCATFSGSTTPQPFNLTVVPDFPANDYCTAAQSITITSGTGTVTANNAFARPGLDPNFLPACATSAKDLFYTFNTGVGGTSNWIISTCTGTTQDTVVEVFPSCGSVALGCNDDTIGCGSGTQSSVTVALTASTIYTVRVSSKGASPAGGPFTLTIQSAAPPANDVCASPTTIAGSGGTATGTVQFATLDGPATACSVSVDKDMWYSFTPTATASWRFSTCGSTADTVLELWSACAGSVLACNDDFGGACGVGSQFDVASLAAGTYLVRLAHKTGGADGSISISIQPSPPANDTCSAPTALTLNIPAGGTTLGATNDYTVTSANPPFSGVGQTTSTAPGRDSVFSFTAPTAGKYSFRISGYNTAQNAVIYVVNTCPAPGLVATASILGAANRNSSNAAEEVPCITLSASQTVYLIVDDNTASNTGSNFTAEVSACSQEVEPNDAVGTATSFANGDSGMTGAVGVTSDVDFYSLGTLSAGARVFAMTEALPGNTGDTNLRVTNATDTIEFDDDDGDVTFGSSGFNSVIGGAIVAAGGPTYLRVNHNSGTAFEPYRLYAVVQTSTPVAETEPNDTTANANSSGLNYFSGTMTSGTDVDLFSFTGYAGQTVFISADCYPNHSVAGSGVDLSLNLLNSGGTQLFASNINGSGTTVSPGSGTGNLAATLPAFPGEGLVFRLPTTGTYYARVTGAAAGSYLLSIATFPAPSYCTAGSTMCDAGSSKLHITNVNFYSINNTSGDGSATSCYQNFIAQSTGLQRTLTYPITVTAANDIVGNAATVWVDWNQNVDLTDVGESFTLTQGPVGTYTGTITVPVGAALGSTRIRVRVGDTANLPCGQTVSGEVEDYTATIQAAPVAPANDPCGSPAAVTLGTSIAGSTILGTNDYNEACDSGGVASRDVWYSFTPAGPGIVTLNTCTLSPGDTVMSLYTGTCGSLVFVACNDNCGGAPCAGPGSCLTQAVTAQPYLVRVSDKGAGFGVNFTLASSFAASPANDNCSSPTTVPAAGGSVAGNTLAATLDGPATACLVATDKDVWFTWSPTSVGTWRIATCGAVGDTIVELWSDCPASSGTVLACNDDFGGACGVASQFDVCQLAIGTYKIRVANKSGFGLGGAFTLSVASAPPCNDTCATATVVAPVSITNGTNIGAAAETGLPASCSGPTGSGSQQFTYQPGVWYLVTSASAGTITMDTLTAAPVSPMDTKIHVFSGTCASLTCVTANDDAQGTPFRSKVAFRVVPGTNYYVLVAGFSAATGNFVLTSRFDPTPANDLCTTPTAITGSGSIAGTTLGATGENNTSSSAMPSCNGSYSFFDVWYLYTAQCTGTVTFDTCGAYDTVLSIHTACPTLTANNQNGTNCNDEGGALCTPGSKISGFAITAGNTYLLRVVGKDPTAAVAPFTLTYTPSVVPPTPPTSASVDIPTYCSGAAPANITLTAAGGTGATLAWYTGSCGGTPVGTGTPLVLTAPGTTTTYYARWENTCGNTTCESVTVTVNASPVAPSSASVDSPSYCSATAPAMITLTAVGGSGDTLNWYSGSCGGTPVGTGSPLTIAAPIASTTYYARWESVLCGDSTCASASVTVNATPTPPTSASVDSPTYCSGAAPADITLTAVGGSGDTLNWYSGSCGGTPVGTGSPLTIAAPGASITYYARWESTACGVTACESVSVTVNASPVAPTSASVDSPSYCSDSAPAMITLTAVGGSGDTLNWYSGSCGGSLVGSGSPLTIAAPGASTTYYARWETVLCGNSACASASVTVNASPVAPTSASVDSPSYCSDSAPAMITLTAVGGSGDTLAWYSGSCGGTPVGAGSPLTIAAPVANTTYYARWETTACGNSSCVSASVTIQPAPTASAGGPYAGVGTAAVAIVGSASNYASVSWSSSGTGTFDDATMLSTNYNPSPADVIAGTITLTLTAQPIAPCSNPATSNATLTLTSPCTTPATTYVDDGYVGLPNGTSVSFPWPGSVGGPLKIGCDAFATIQGGIDGVLANGIVNVAAGSYAELIRVNKDIDLVGPQATICVQGGFRPGAEAVVRPPAAASALTDVLVYISTSNITISGFTFDGDNLVAGGETSGAELADVANLISNGSFEDDVTYPFVHVKNILIRDNILRNVNDVAVQLFNDGSFPVSDSNVISCNDFNNIGGDNVIGTGGPYDRVGVLLYNDTYANVDVNSFRGCNIGVQDGNNYRANGGPAASMDSNDMTGVETIGLWHNLHYAGASPWTISDNNIDGLDNINSVGIFVTSLYSAATASVTNNTISDVGNGMEFWNNPVSPAVNVSGGTISSCDGGIKMYNSWSPGYGDGESTSLTVSNITLFANFSFGIYLLDTPGDDPGSPVRGTLTADVSDLDASGSLSGVIVEGSRARAFVHDSLTSVTGNGVGILVNAGKARIQTTNLTGNAEAGLAVLNNGIADAGQCTPGTDVTGLGVSTGGNDFSGYGFDLASPWAIENFNASSDSDVYAANNNFGAIAIDDINDAIDGNGGAFSDVLYDQTGNPVFVGQPVGATSCTGGNVTFFSLAYNITGYQWYKDAVLLPGETGPNLALTNVTTADNGDYTVVITDLCGNTTTSDTATLTVTPDPVAPSSASSSPMSYCSGAAPATITLSATGGSGTTLEWFTGSCGGTAVGTGNNLVIAAPGATTTYYARYTNSCGSSGCASVTVTVNASPVAPTSASSSSTSYCSDAAPATITLTASGGSGGVLEWYSAVCGGTSVGTGNNLVIAAPAVTTTYYVRWETAFCGNSGCASVTVTVNASPVAPTSASSSSTGYCSDSAPATITLSAIGGSGDSLEWYSGSCGGAPVASGNNAVIAAPASTTTYFARWVTSLCGNSACASVTVTVQAAPTASAGGPYGGCGVGSVSVSGTASNAASTAWTTSGDGSFAAPGSLATTYTPGPADILAGTVTLTLTASPIAPCSNPAVSNATLTITSPAIIYVDDDYTGLPSGTAVNFPFNALPGPHTIGCDAFATVSGGVGAAPAGGTVNVAAGSYSDNVNITRQVTIEGAGSGTCASGANPAMQSVITAASPASPVVSISDAGGASAVSRLTIRGVRITGAGPSMAGVLLSSTAVRSFFTFDDVAVASNGGSGIEFVGASGFADVEVLNSSICSNYQGIRTATTLASFNGLLVSGCEIRDNVFNGVAMYGNTGSGFNPTNVSVMSTQLSNNGQSNNLFQGSGDLSFFEFNGDATISNVTIATSGRVPVQFRGRGSTVPTWLPAGNIAINGLTVTGAADRPAIYIQNYSSVASILLNNVDLSGVTSLNGPGGAFSVPGMIVDHTGATPLELNNTIFPCQGGQTLGYVGLAMFNTGGAHASCSTVFTGATTLAQKENCVFDFNDFPAVGNVTFDDVVIAVQPMGGSVCAGGNFTFTVFASGAPLFSYQWYQGATPVGTNSDSYMITGATLADAGAYTVVVTNACGSVTSAIANFTVYSNPVTPSSASVDSPTYCSGSAPATITLSAAGGSGDTLAWYTGSCGGSLVGTGNNLVLAAPGATTTYYARWETVNCGNSGCASVAVTVNASPVAPTSASVSDPTYCSGAAPATITLSASGGSGDSLEWYSGSCGGTPVASGNNAVIAAPATTTTYYARWETSLCGNSACASVTVTVNASPIAPSSASSSVTSYCISATPATITLSAVGGSGDSLEWYSGSCGGTSVGSGNGLVIAAPGSTTTYYARWETTLCGNSACASVMVTVNPNPATPTIISVVPSQLCDGGPVTLTATAGAGETVDWYSGSCGGPLLGSGSPFNTNVTGTTTFYARARDLTTGCESVACDSISVTVYPSPVAPTSASSSSTSYCSGSVANITLSASGGSGDTLAWYSGSCGGTPVGTGSPLVIAAPASSTTYYARWETANCGNSSCASVAVNVQPGPMANAGGPYTICADGVAALLGATTNASSSVWTSTGSGTFGNANSPITVYFPSPADITAGSVTLTLTAQPVAPCTTPAVSNVTLTILALPVAPTAASSSDNNYCTGTVSNITLTATGGSGSKLAWFTGSCGGGSQVASGTPAVIPAPLVTTTYYATWINACGQSTCASVTVTVLPNPVAPTSLTVSQSSWCAGSGPANITLGAVGGSGTTFQWFTGSCGGTSIGTGTSLNIPAPTSTTTYFGRWSNTCGDSACAQVTVTVNPQPVAPTSASVDSNNFCESTVANITLTASGGSGDVLKWYTGSCGGVLIGTGSPLVIAAPTGTTTYYARWETTSCGASSCANVTVTVLPLPVAPTSAFSSHNNYCSTSVANITLTSVGGSGTTVQWFDDSCGGNLIGTGVFINIPAPLVTTTYYARWTNGCGNSTCTSVTVLVQPATGACCSGWGTNKMCQVVPPASCNPSPTPAGAYRGNCTTCTPVSCCPADYNNNGIVSVQDIFDFMADFLAPVPPATADFNNNTTVSTQDLFDFLAAYFAGC